MQLFRKHGLSREFQLYLKDLKKQDPLAASVVEVLIHQTKHQYPLVIQKGKRLLLKIGHDPRLSWDILLALGLAYVNIGKIQSAESSLIKALEKAELTGDPENLSITKLQMLILKVFKAEYPQAYKELLDYKADPRAWQPHKVDYWLGICAFALGRTQAAARFVESFIRSSPKPEEDPLYFANLETKGLILRIKGRFSQAMEVFLASSEGYMKHGSAYAALPMAKAMELSYLAHMEPPPDKLVKRVLTLAKRGGWGEQAAAQEISALLQKEPVATASMLFEASKSYKRAYQDIEAVFSGLAAARVAWECDSPVFSKSLKHIAHLIPLDPGIENDPLLKDIVVASKPLLSRVGDRISEKEGIEAHMIGGLRVVVKGEEIKTEKWHNNKAIRAFIYLLLSSQHRLPDDHLFYMLWPKKAYNKKNRWNLYSAVNIIRNNIRDRNLLTKNRDFYQLEDTWTDLEELENLIRLADATQDPDQKEEYLSRARELAKGELLPEFPYDRHIDEYRQYYRRLRKKLGLK